MATNQRRRQKKLERKTAKRKERRHELIRAKNRGLAELMAAAASAPILHCCTAESLWEEGLAGVLISRQLSHGNVAFAMFLVDMDCLGVKDAFGRVCSLGEYNEMYENFEQRNEVVVIKPADVRSVVEDAVAYARRFGIEPHPDYHKLAPIFGDIDPRESLEVFEFGGEDGKPHFMAGPTDNAARCRHILSLLDQHCGAGGYHFTMPGAALSRSPMERLSLDDEDEDDDDEDWEEDAQ